MQTIRRLFSILRRSILRLVYQCLIYALIVGFRAVRIIQERKLYGWAAGIFLTMSTSTLSLSMISSVELQSALACARADLQRFRPRRNSGVWSRKSQSEDVRGQVALVCSFGYEPGKS